MPSGDAYTATHVLIDQLPEIRGRRGLTAAQLAERCAKLGAPKMDRSVIARIETRARGVSLDEVLILAAALDISPLHLIAPQEDNTMVQVTPEVTVLTWEFRSWLRGIDPLPGQDEQAFATAIPASEWKERSGRRAEAERAVARIEHQLRVLRARARLVADDLAEVEGPFGTGRLPELNPQARRLELKLNAVYDQMAELAVDLEDAQAQAAELRRLEAAIESTMPMEPLSGTKPSADSGEGKH